MESCDASSGRSRESVLSAPPTSTFGSELLALEPRRSGALAAASESLSRLTGRSEQGFVTELSGTMTLWMLDLPASERNHHRDPFGLLEHSLEVGALTAQDLDERWRVKGGARELSAQERARWARVALGMGFFHDIGKVLHFDVGSPDAGGEWNPLRESLASFKARVGWPLLERTPWRFRKKRGLHQHEGAGTAVTSAVLADPSWNEFSPDLKLAMEAYAARGLAGQGAYAVPLEYLAVRVQEADVRSSRTDRKSSGEKKEADHERTV